MGATLRGAGVRRRDWNRWDSPRGRTLYAHATAHAAYLEAVSPLSSVQAPKTFVEGLFDDVEEDEVGLLLTTQAQTQMPCAPMHNQVTRGWRNDRLHYEYIPPASGWFVDLQTEDSVSALGALTTASTGPLTLSHITGEDRNLTTQLAGLVRAQVLDDGSQPLGIKYISAASDMVAYAIWLRAIDDGKPASKESVKPGPRRPISRTNPDLQRAARFYGMKVQF